MKKNSTQAIKIIILGLILSAGLSFAFSQPASPYPANTDMPINVSATPQAKGGLPLSGSLLNINGILSSTGLVVFGNTAVAGTMQVNSLNQNNQSPATWPAPVCTNNLGKLIPCGISPTAVNGICGTANKTYPSTATSFGSDTFCSPGTVSSPTPVFPASGNSVAWTCAGSNGGNPSSTCTAIHSTQVNPPQTKTRTYTINSSGQQIVSGDSCTGCTATTFIAPSNTVSGSITAQVWGAGGGGGAGISDTVWPNIDFKQNPAGGGGGGGGYFSGTPSGATVTVGKGGVAGVGYTNTSFSSGGNGTFDEGKPGQAGGQSSAGNIIAGGGGGGKGAKIIWSVSYNPSTGQSTAYNIRRSPTDVGTQSNGLGGAGGTGSTAGNNGSNAVTAAGLTSSDKGNNNYYLDEYCDVGANGGGGGAGANSGANGGAGMHGYSGTQTNQSASVFLAGAICIPACGSGMQCNNGTCVPSTGGGPPPSPQCGHPLPAVKGQDGKVVITWQQ